MTQKKSAKSSDEESNICEHRAPDTNDIVANASKTEVFCMQCGITLPKPQCFYSLGSLCIDCEICETDSDDINRHPVVDIDMEPPLVESQSCNLEGSQDSGDLGQIKEPFRTQMYKAYNVNEATTAS